MTFDGAGNTLSTARELNITPTNQIITDWVGSTDTNDFYRFNLSNSSSFNLALNGLVADADVQLIRDANSNSLVDSGEVIQSSTAGGSTAESIVRTLDAGTYFIRVYPFSGNTNYNLNVSATISDFAGNTLDAARQVTFDSTLSNIYGDWVGNTDTNDYYRFSFGSRTSFNLTLDGLSANTDVQLIRDANNNGIVESNEIISTSSNGGTTAESISQVLDAGNYYIRVYPDANANTSYNLKVSATINDYAGNTLNSARQITLNSTGSTYTDWVGSTDTNDFYRFSIGANSNFNLALNGLVADADVQLIRDANSNGVVDSEEVIASSTASSSAAESIIRVLDAGSYYIRVYPYGSANTSYNLNVSATPEDYAGNTLSSARQITLNSTGSSSYTDWVGSADTNDYYRFTLGATSNFNLGLNGLSENADVQLLNSSGIAIASSTTNGTAAEIISRTLDAGTYYVRVYPEGTGNTYYNLNVSATINDYAGNTLNSARQITLNSTGSTYTDWVDSTDTNDFYRFSIGANSNFNLALNGLVADADVQLIRDANSNGVVDSEEVIASSTASSSAAESIIRVLDAGSYYIRVYPYGSANTSYNLNVSATPEDYAGNTLSSARQITLNSTGSSSYTDWVGSADTNDYYRFTLGATSNFNLGLNGLSENADVQLLNSSGNAIASSTTNGTAAEIISQTLDAGTYYVRVYPGDSGANTFYNLNIETSPNQLNQAWIRQMGTAGGDLSNSVATDSAGNVYITGYTDGSLGGTNAGGQDAWLAKYNSSGTLLWTKQLGTTNDDLCLGVTVDSAGNVYITGDTDGALGGTNAGGRDAWVAKYNSGGTLLWTKQLGNAGDDFSYGVAVDSAGNVYITGYTDGSLGGTNAGNRDAWLAKYNSSGTLLWTKQLGTSGDDSSYSIAVDANGNVYITGDTDGALGGSNVGSDTYDSWIAKYNSNGALLWTRQLGTVGDDFSYSVAVDGTGNVYITGDTDGSLGRTSAGDVDAWVAKYDSSGNQLFIRQLGTSSQDSSIAIAVDSFGNFYITGDSSGALGGTNAGNADAWLAKYDSSGNQLFIRKLGTSSLDSSYGVAIDNTGNVYITGYTGGALAGNNVGNLDAWVAKYR